MNCLWHSWIFVDDLDSELEESDIFLLLNNAGRYLAAYTRHMVAWATGLCLIVHGNSQKAIPELQPMENVLAGSTPHEIAAMIRQAATDPALNERIRRGGRLTYEKYFMPSKIAEALQRSM